MLTTRADVGVDRLGLAGGSSSSSAWACRPGSRRRWRRKSPGRRCGSRARRRCRRPRPRRRRSRSAGSSTPRRSCGTTPTKMSRGMKPTMNVGRARRPTPSLSSTAAASSGATAQSSHVTRLGFVVPRRVSRRYTAAPSAPIARPQVDPILADHRYHSLQCVTSGRCRRGDGATRGDTPLRPRPLASTGEGPSRRSASAEPRCCRAISMGELLVVAFLGGLITGLVPLHRPGHPRRHGRRVHRHEQVTALRDHRRARRELQPVGPLRQLAAQLPPPAPGPPVLAGRRPARPALGRPPDPEGGRDHRAALRPAGLVALRQRRAVASCSG